ncbi:allantoate deiminase [Radiobacillus sp. PE A8.2]|uniref:allantoate deiminase n=1 Tax=Radiobacillus sp. PE A8.2 TaxID=3380349 RepID=UPI00388DD2B7
MGIRTSISHQQTENVETLVKWLASFGQSESGGVNRLLYNSSWTCAQHALKQKMNTMGFSSYFDSVGNLFGRLEGSDPATKKIVTGSHIDTVIEGGVYDGVYGIIASLLAVKHLYKTYGQPKKTIEVVSLCEEEGSRFPLTFWGSGSITGRYSLDDITTIKDTDNVSFIDAMTDAGFNPANYHSPRRDDIGYFIELHVEQGVVLERNQKSLGMVSHIVGQRRFNVCVTGESNHAGTTPMSYRKDAMTAAAKLISYIAEQASQFDPNLVATVGKLNAKPNVPNVIAGEVDFTLDVRHYNQEMVDQFCEKLFTHFQAIAKHTDTAISVSKWMDASPVAMNTELTEMMKTAAEHLGISYQEMISGAGHDAQVFGAYCPTALLFVPSVNGISHSPKEFTSNEDLQNGVDVLAAFLYELAY